MVESSDACTAGVLEGEAVARVGAGTVQMARMNTPELSATGLCERDKGDRDAGEGLLLLGKRVLGDFSSPGRGTSIANT